MKTSLAESSTEDRTYCTLVFDSLLRTISFNYTLEIILAMPNDDHAKKNISQQSRLDSIT